MIRIAITAEAFEAMAATLRRFNVICDGQRWVAPASRSSISSRWGAALWLGTIVEAIDVEKKV
jgi:hypothetical protein